MKNSIGKPCEGKLHARFDAACRDSLHFSLIFEKRNSSVDYQALRYALISPKLANQAKMLYICSKYIVMIRSEERLLSGSKRYNPRKSIERAKRRKENRHRWKIAVTEREFSWTTRMDRVAILREGLPYDSIEYISKRIGLPVKHVLSILGVPQTTYNKKKRDNDLLSRRDSEVILILTELLDFGIEVFNNEKEKFQRWLTKPNISMGGVTPESLFDSFTGIQEVRNCLNRLEYGNLA